MKNGKRAVRKSSVILKGQPPVDPDKNRQALDSRGGFDFYIYKRNAVLLYFILQEKANIKELCGAMLKLLTKPYECHMIDFLCDAGNYFEMTRFCPMERTGTVDPVGGRFHLFTGVQGCPKRHHAAP